MFGLFLVVLSLHLAFMPEYSLRRGAAAFWTVLSGLSGNGGGVLGVQNPLDNVSPPSTSGSDVEGDPAIVINNTYYPQFYSR